MGPTCTPEFRWDFREPSSSYPFKGGTRAMPRGWKLILLQGFFIVDVHTLTDGCFLVPWNPIITRRFVIPSQTLRTYSLVYFIFPFSRYRVADSRKDRCSRIVEKTANTRDRPVFPQRLPSGHRWEKCYWR